MPRIPSQIYQIMKTQIYVIALLILSIFSCSNDPVENTNDLDTYVLIEDSQFNFTRSTAIPAEENLCSRIALISENHVEVGVIDFILTSTEIIASFKTLDNFTLVSTNLSMIDPSIESFPMLANGIPMVSAFEYAETHHGDEKVFAYTIEMESFADAYAFIPFATVQDQNGILHDVWGIANKFTDMSTAAFPQIAPGKCGDIKIECYESSDVEFYIPLSQETSGVFDVDGTSADIVSITPDSPTTEGYLEVELMFGAIPKGLGKAKLSIDFNDLDLYTDYISSGGNEATFVETFTLRNEMGETVAILDGSHHQDGNFNWIYDLPNGSFDGEEFTLYVTFNTHLELTQGNGLQVTNTIEGMFNISICGEIRTGIE